MDSRLTPEQSAAIRSALARGSKIEAVKLYREATASGLAEAKAAVERIAKDEVFDPADAARLLVSPRPDRPAPSGMTGGKLATIVAALRQGRKIEAIKLFREATGMGLAESKEAVEAMESVVGSGENAFPPAPEDRGAARSGAEGPRLPGPALAPDGRTPLPNWDPFGEKRKSGCFGALALCLAGPVALAVLLFA